MRLLSTIGKGCETMKRGTYIKKQLLAWILMTALLLPVIPGNVTFAFTENTTEDGFVTDITGLDVWENVRLKKSVTITENVTVTGQVKLESGAAIYISSGRFILDSQATIDGDIYIEKSGMAELWGTVNGTVYVNSTDASVQVEDWDGSLVRGRNFVMFPSSYAESVILSGVGTGYIDGTVGTLKIAKNYDGDFGSEVLLSLSREIRI